MICNLLAWHCMPIHELSHELGPGGCNLAVLVATLLHRRGQASPWAQNTAKHISPVWLPTTESLKGNACQPSICINGDL